jgi:anti-sigma B factor antagonist
MHHHLAGVTVISVAGEVDLATADQLQAVLRLVRRPGDRVVLDLTCTGFLDCSALRVLVRAHHEIRADGGMLCLAAPQRGPARVLKVAGIDRHMPVHASVEQALSLATAAARRLPAAPMADDRTGSA